MPVVSNIVACGLAILLLGIALFGVKKLRGTTLAAPCIWVAISAICIAVLAFVQINAADSLGLSVFRFAVAASTLTPVMAVLGAKRPQDRGWQWVVLTLWLVIVWPAAQALANPAGPRVELAPLWKMFVVGVIALGPFNYIATRNTTASLLTVVGQVLLFGEFLGFPEADAWDLTSALICFLLAAVVVILPAVTEIIVAENCGTQTARWLQFRDCYGAFWGLRIMQRVNETAGLREWPVQLTWSGYEQVNDEPLNAMPIAEIDQTLDTLLRRFF